jgi:hypothetical protein
MTQVPTSGIPGGISTASSLKVALKIPTVSDAEPWTPSVVAVMVARPPTIAVTRPVELTVATAASDDDQVNVLLEIAFPLASCALAVS